jgi:glycosyltransferase involved in cell wall biosynthesis
MAGGAGVTGEESILGGEDDWPDQITAPYLLVLNIPLRTHEGRYWADPLWAKDLALHTRYIRRLSLFCPTVEQAPADDWRPVTRAVEVISAGPPSKWQPLALPALLARMILAVGRADVVHIGLIGQPFPLGWLATPLARLRQRLLVVVVESSFWRAPKGASVRRRLSAALRESINRRCVNACDLALFTTADYRDRLATRPRGKTYVAPATWIDRDHVLSEGALPQVWSTKQPRLLFAGRLTVEKGVLDLLAAAELSGCAVDVVGEGELREACAAAATLRPDRLRLLDSVPHGQAFSTLLDRYPAVVVPTRSDEQPRVLFDAFARGVPAIVSGTAANREIAEHSGACRVFPVGDIGALAALMEQALRDVEGLRPLSEHALGFARSHTHSAMHKTRARLLVDSLDAGGPRR